MFVFFTEILLPHVFHHVSWNWEDFDWGAFGDLLFSSQLLDGENYLLGVFHTNFHCMAEVLLQYVLSRCLNHHWQSHWRQIIWIKGSGLNDFYIFYNVKIIFDILPTWLLGPPDTIRLRVLELISARVGLINNSPSTMPTRTAPAWPQKQLCSPKIRTI